MTLAQLQSFVTAARLGSVRAAAVELGVSEPAVSLAVAALRREIGDELYVRSGHGIALTAGGRRLAGIAGEILALAEQARRAVGEGEGKQVRMHIAATSPVAEHVIGPLLDSFAGGYPDVEVAVEEAPPDAFADLLDQRRVDIALGPRPALDRPDIDAVPFLRYRMIVVAGTGNPLGSLRGLSPALLSGQPWLVGPGPVDASPLGAYLERHSIHPREIRAFPSDAAALAAAGAGEGLMLAIAHTILHELRRPTLVRLDAPGTPVADLWFASTLGAHRCLPEAHALQRFITTRESIRSITARDRGVPSARFRPPAHVTLWSSVGSS